MPSLFMIWLMLALLPPVDATGEYYGHRPGHLMVLSQGPRANLYVVEIYEYGDRILTGSARHTGWNLNCYFPRHGTVPWRWGINGNWMTREYLGSWVEVFIEDDQREPAHGRNPK